MLISFFHFSYFSQPTVLFLLFSLPFPTVISTLSLHDALPICVAVPGAGHHHQGRPLPRCRYRPELGDRKSTRLNSSHVATSYAVFCLKKKKNKKTNYKLH